MHALKLVQFVFELLKHLTKWNARIYVTVVTIVIVLLLLFSSVLQGKH